MNFNVNFKLFWFQKIFRDNIFGHKNRVSELVPAFQRKWKWHSKIKNSGKSSMEKLQKWSSQKWDGESYWQIFLILNKFPLFKTLLYCQIKKKCNTGKFYLSQQSVLSFLLNTPGPIWKFSWGINYDFWKTLITTSVEEW